jgi:hypothetical protein
MIRKSILLGFTLALLSSVAVAQQKPDFSGTWKLNVAKSDFGALPGPDSRTDVITHKEPSLTDEVTSEGAQGKQQYTVKYTTDGKEATNQIGGREVKSALKWEASTLLIDSKLLYNETEVNAQFKWSLSADGKTLTINAHYTSSLGETDQKIIMEKEEAKPAAVPAKTP